MSMSMRNEAARRSIDQYHSNSEEISAKVERRSTTGKPQAWRNRLSPAMDDERRRLIEQCGDGMMAIKEGRIDYANEAAAALAKASDRHALAGRALAELLPHYPLPRGQEQQASAPQTNTEGQLSGEPSPGPADVGMGAPRCTQVRRQRQAQEFKTMVENSPDAILRFDRMMRYMYVNPAIEAITGLKPEDYAGKTNADLGLPEDFVIACDRAVRTALDSGTEQSFDFEFGNQQEKRFYCARACCPKQRRMAAQ